MPSTPSGYPNSREAADIPTVSLSQVVPTIAGMRSLFTWNSLSGGLKLLIAREVWLATLFLLLNCVFGVMWFVVLLTMITFGVGLSYTLVGLVILALAMRLWVAGAALERERVETFLGVRIDPMYRPLPERGLLERIRVRAGDPAVWRDLLYLVLLFPLGTAEGVLTLVMWGLQISALGAILLLPYYWITSSISGTTLDAMVSYTAGALPLVLLAVLAGLALALVVPRAAMAMASAHAALARLLLTSVGSADREKRLAERVEDLRESRSRLVEATLLERRRIERDLHDGVQQQLVSIAMDLGLARQKMQTGLGATAEAAAVTEAEVAALIENAHAQTKQSIRDIRDLARGLHPAVLSDRGLDAAISALAERCSVPVDVKVDLDHRPPEAVESTAYFVVAEALTNVAKHSHAKHAWVNVSCARGVLTLEIRDNGTGGAAPASGSGLSGLADRVAAFDGHLAVQSPKGGPTLIQADMPCT